MRKTLWTLCIRSLWLVLALGMGLTAGRAEEPLKYRWVYLAQNLLVPKNVDAVKAILQRAKAAGYNGVVLNDSKLSTLDMLGGGESNYLAHLADIKRTADSMGFTVVSGLTNPGSGNPILAHDPNLAESIRMTDIPYRVRNGVAQLEADPAIALANASFDRGDQNKLEGFLTQDGIGTGTFLDREVRRSGKGSLRMERFAEVNKPYAMVRVTQQVAVKPGRQYRLKVYIRTQGVDKPGSVQILVKNPAGRELGWALPVVQGTQDWTLAQVVFPAMDARQAVIYLGVWGGGNGKVWWTDATLEDAGLVNVVRRSACPLVVKGESGQVFLEGPDFEPFSDPGMGTQPWVGSYGFSQPSPLLKVAKGSRIQEGQRLLISGWVVKVIQNGQVAACLGDDGFFRCYENEVAAQAKTLQPSGYLMGHDEIRVINQDPACTSMNLSAGDLLAWNISRCARIIRKADPKAGLYLWSDMFTPTQNAHDGYYLVGGDLTGSWYGIPKDTVIFNWDWVKMRDAATFFAGQGLKQILAGYYDRDPKMIAEWLRQTKGIPGIQGVMYCTWEDNFTDLEAFAKAAWGHP